MFFFQAEDGIRDKLVTGVQTLLFRSARERIHRIMADIRLLAIPASRSRVADSDPN